MTDYAALFRRLYAREPAGLAREPLERAEQRLGVCIPPPLRALYLGCGREEGVMASHNRFVAPHALDLTDGRLVFCQENQGVCVWGCVPDGDDPGAEVGNVLPSNALEWHSEEVGLSRFLEIMIYLQTAWGGFQHAGDLPDFDGAMPRIEADWEEVVRHNGLTIYEKPGMLITSFDGQEFLIAAARTAEGLAYLERELGTEPL